MEQKVVQIGNSIGVIIPQALAKNNLKPGDVIRVEKDPESDMFIIYKNKKKNISSITPHFLEVLERVNKQYGVALKEIAER